AQISFEGLYLGRYAGLHVAECDGGLGKTDRGRHHSKRRKLPEIHRRPFIKNFDEIYQICSFDLIIPLLYARGQASALVKKFSRMERKPFYARKWRTDGWQAAGQHSQSITPKIRPVARTVAGSTYHDRRRHHSNGLGVGLCRDQSRVRGLRARAPRPAAIP